MRTCLCITLFATFIVMTLCLIMMTVEAKKASKSKSTSEEIEIPTEGGKNNQQRQQQKASSSNSKPETKSETPVASSQQQKEQQQQRKESSSSSSTNSVAAAAAATITIRGQLSNITRVAKDPVSGHPIRIHPRDAATISVNGGEHIFYTDIGGAFALVLQVPPKGTFAGTATATTKNNNNALTFKDRVALYQLDIDWEKLVFPRVLVEVDEFGNYRAYLDNSGRVVGARGRIGIDSKNNKNTNTNINNEEEDDDSFFNSNTQHQNQNLQIEALGEVEYFVPRQQFRITDLFKNPMILMMLVTAGMVYLMPQLVDQDEMKKQMRELQQGAGQDEGAAAAVTGGGKKKQVKN